MTTMLSSAPGGPRTVGLESSSSSTPYADPRLIMTPALPHSDPSSIRFTVLFGGNHAQCLVRLREDEPMDRDDQDDRNQPVSSQTTVHKMSMEWKAMMCEQVKRKLCPSPWENGNDWQESVNLERRSLIIYKILEVMLKINPNGSFKIAEKLLDEGVSGTIGAARDLEAETFRSARSTREYFGTIARAIVQLNEVDQLQASTPQSPLQIDQGNSINHLESIEHQLHDVTSSDGSSNARNRENKVIRSPTPFQGPVASSPTRDNVGKQGLSDQSQLPVAGPQKRPATPTPPDIDGLADKRKRLDEEEFDSRASDHVNIPEFHIMRNPTASTVPRKIHKKKTNSTTSETLSRASVSPLVDSKLNSEIVSKNEMVSAEQLKAKLLKPLMKLFHHKTESILFKGRKDVRGIAEAAVNRPMNLRKVRKKVQNGSYSEPWKFIDEVVSIFDQVLSHSKKNSKIFRLATKLAAIFNSEMEPLMKELGYCCANRYFFYPPPMPCYGKPLCKIERNSKYYSYENRNFYCVKCFKAIPGDEVELQFTGVSGETSVLKTMFSFKRNDVVQAEDMVSCTVCDRKFHSICVLHMDDIWPKGFVCKNCLDASGRTGVAYTLNSTSLAKTSLSRFIEKRVNNFLREMGSKDGYVVIRVVATTEKRVTIQPSMKRTYVATGKLHPPFPYRFKTICAFQKHASPKDGSHSKEAEVCFFAMQVQEYGSECPSPNSRRVYIAYLDSVPFFSPKKFRTSVYFEILLGYLAYVKRLGFSTAHLWACPPIKGTEYIFYRHPTSQKFPTAKLLQKWYTRLLDKGTEKNIVLNFSDILAYSEEEKVSLCTDLPYFEGDHWPAAIEQSIAKSESEIRKRNQGRKTKKTNTKSEKKGTSAILNGDDASSKLLPVMREWKEHFFAIRLQSAETASPLKPILDPDPVIKCDLMDNRDNFLTFATKNDFEFSSLRRAKYSTMGMLYELHHQKST